MGSLPWLVEDDVFAAAAELEAASFWIKTWGQLFISSSSAHVDAFSVWCWLTIGFCTAPCDDDAAWLSLFTDLVLEDAGDCEEFWEVAASLFVDFWVVAAGCIQGGKLDEASWDTARCWFCCDCLDAEVAWVDVFWTYAVPLCCCSPPSLYIREIRIVNVYRLSVSLALLFACLDYPRLRID